MPVKVSVVVATYNSPPELAGLVESLDDQTLPADEYEMVFVDDGSSDDTHDRLTARSPPSAATCRCTGSPTPAGQDALATWAPRPPPATSSSSPTTTTTCSPRRWSGCMPSRSRTTSTWCTRRRSSRAGAGPAGSPTASTDRGSTGSTRWWCRTSARTSSTAAPSSTSRTSGSPRGGSGSRTSATTGWPGHAPMRSGCSRTTPATSGASTRRTATRRRTTTTCTGPRSRSRSPRSSSSRRVTSATSC